MGNRRFLFRVPEGEEIIDFMTRFFGEFQVTSGVISAIGSLIDPKIGYFDRKKGEYVTKVLHGTYELISLMGNVSVKDGVPFVHVHVALGDEDGRVYGGHLVEARVFVAEVFVQELDVDLRRKRQASGLYLWDPLTLNDPRS